VEEFLRRQLHYAVTDVYDTESASFDFDDYQLKAINQFIQRYGDRKDGSFSYVAALVMYWDEIVRGLIHWERTGYQGHLSEHVPNQVFVTQEFYGLTGDQRHIAAVHREYRNSRSWRITAPLRRINSIKTSLFRNRK
jgi:hypothetical protein